MKRKISFTKLVPVVIVLIVFIAFNIPQTSELSQYIDYRHDNIQEAIAYVEDNSETQLDKITLTAIYIHDNVIYQTSSNVCLRQTAKEVLEIGAGDCVSTTKLAASMLTGMNIPIQLMEGCVIDTTRSFFIPEDNAIKVTSKNSTNIGQLHSWLRAFDGKQWYTIETTAGVIFPVEYEPDYGYIKYGGIVNSKDPYDLCLLDNEEFVGFCKGE